MKKTLTAIAMSTAVALSAPAVAQTSFTIDTSNSYVNVGSNSTACIFGSCSLSASLAPLSDFQLNVGESKTFDFANIFVTGGFGVGTASLDAALAFLTPAGSAGTSGTANYLRIGGIFTPGALAGSLVWDNAAQNVTSWDGSVYSVTFGNIASGGFTSGVTVPVTVRLESISSPAPEPATWALLIFGFGAAGAMLRSGRRKSTLSHV